MNILDRELNETINVWPTVSKVLSTLHNEKEYNKAVSLLDRLIDEVCKHEDHSRESLIETLGTLIKDYEDRNIHEPDGDPIDSLKCLIEEHKLKPSGLKELGNQLTVSDILTEKKNLTLNRSRH